MTIRIKNITFLIIFLIFILFNIKYYISEKNVIATNKSRTQYLVSLNNISSNLPVLKNDTSNIIIYINEIENFKKKRKKRLWEKLFSNKNE